MNTPKLSAVRRAVTGFCQGATITLSLALLAPCAAWPAPPAPQKQASKPAAAKPAPCRNVRFEDGSTARVRVTPSGSWSRCEYSFDLRLKAGAARKPLELRAVTPDRCLVWVSEAALAKDKGLIERAWSLCVDSSLEEAEKEAVTRR